MSGIVKVYVVMTFGNRFSSSYIFPNMGQRINSGLTMLIIFLRNSITGIYIYTDNLKAVINFVDRTSSQTVIKRVCSDSI